MAIAGDSGAYAGADNGPIAVASVPSTKNSGGSKGSQTLMVGSNGDSTTIVQQTGNQSPKVYKVSG